MPEFAPNSWEARANAHVLYGFTDMPSLHARGPVVLTHGRGIHVFDVHGRSWIDANSGLWNMVAGFDHKGLAEAAKAQYDRFPGYHAFFGRLSDQTVELSERLIEVSPFPDGKVFFTSSGSEANDTMVKMLWFINTVKGRPEKRKIITRENGYHGVTVATASMTGKPYNKWFGLPLPEFKRVSCPHYWRHGEPGESEADYVARLAAELEALIEAEGPQTIAGFFAEPVMGAGGVIVPPAGYFQAIAPVLRRHGIPLISDEVICGFGRTGSIWGCQTYDFMPDAIISSKNLTAGYFPMGAVILGPELATALTEAAEEVEEFVHGFTASGHPVGCAVALKAIDVVLREGLFENLRAVAPRFQGRLRALADLPHIGEARGVGLMGALEAVADKDTKEPFPAELSISERIANTCMDNGLICRPLGQAIVLCPPFIITEGEIDRLFDLLEKSLRQVFREIG
ncbi:MAG: aminotransferase class III-fold pyridoxal phosphate-dependent enzyme [Alphaproteobacteria bacterium]|nr:MAG: aminotransferase class III-fold pyridoxal phosphate-dependent enzyme [Alphaproteobacteria bacterium]